MKVPLHFINEETCHGVKMQGGSITHNMNELEISCLPSVLPEYIEVDLSKTYELTGWAQSGGENGENKEDAGCEFHFGHAMGSGR